MKKRGMSQIVAILLIIIIIFIAVAIVWLAVKEVFQKSAEEITLSKFTLDLDIESIRLDNDSISVKVKRNPGEGDLAGIVFVVYDGLNSEVFEKYNATLKPLEIKTYVLGYIGQVTKVSIAPLIETEPGKIITGPILDVYYLTGFTGEGGGNCTPNCDGKQCGSDGCGGQCGYCISPEVCSGGVCQEGNESCDCSCASETCTGTDCIGGCGETCPGTLTLGEDCQGVQCGPSPHGCGQCSDCGDPGHTCYENTCVPSCTPDCAGIECGPALNGCGGATQCGICNLSAGEWCDAGICSNETCTPECGTRVCGVDPICGELCGICNESAGEWCSAEGQCLQEQFVNNGTVFSIWPIGTGIYFDSEDLPKSGVDYTGYYARFPGSLEVDCLEIREYVIPVIPEIYNMSHVRFVTSSTSIQPDDTYEIWETYTGCTNAL